MKLNIGKYAFNSKKQFNNKIESLHTINDEGESIPDSKFAIITDGLGYIELQKQTFDEDGEELTAQVISTQYHCDVVWYGLEDHPYGWKIYSVDIEDEGISSVAGVSYLENKF